MGWRNCGSAWLLTLFVGLGTVAARAQDKPAPAAPDLSMALEPGSDTQVNPGPIHTLHVYMDLIQVPVLVLDSERDRMKPIEPAKFLVSLDSGPEFHPKHVRQQGDDAITLAILLDLNSQPDIMFRMAKAISDLAPTSLHPKDHVTLYALDCTLLRSLTDVSAEPAALKAGVDHALERWTARRKDKHAVACAKPVGLWDAMGFAMKEIGQLPGRRILLAVTDGNDRGSETDWDNLRKFAQYKGVSVFGYGPRRGRTSVETSNVSPGGRGHRNGVTATQTLTTFKESDEDPFRSICEQSGGMSMLSDPEFVSKQLTRFVAILRERYILEFTRPRNDQPGDHEITVTIAKNARAFIRPAGVSILLADRGENDDSTIPRDTTDAPEIGDRKILKKPN